MRRVNTISPRTALAIACATAGLTLWTASPAAAALVYQPIALTGTDGVYGPNEGAGVTYFSLTSGQPSMNNAGQVVFRGQDSRTGNPNGLWMSSPSANSILAIKGGAMPGGGTYPTGAAASFNSYQINNAGQSAWRLGASTGAFATSAGTPTRFVMNGDFAPGTTTSGPLATFGNLSNGMPLFNQAGNVATMASLVLNATLTPPVVATSGIGNSSGVWIGAPGNPQLVLRQNDTLTSLDPTGNTRVGLMQSLGFVLNGNTRYAVVTALQGSNVITGTGANSNSSMILTNRNGSLESVARHGDAAPDAAGAPTANLYRSIANSAPGFNDLGHIAFTSSLRDAAGTQTATGALFSDVGSGTMRQIAKIGDTLPTIYSRTGSPLSEVNGVTWGLSYGNPLINSADQLLFTPTGLGNTGGTTNTGGIMQMDPNGTMHKIERNGDVAILGGAPNGTDAFFSSTSSYQINALGQVAFMSNLTGVGV